MYVDGNDTIVWMSYFLDASVVLFLQVHSVFGETCCHYGARVESFEILLLPDNIDFSTSDATNK